MVDFTNKKRKNNLKTLRPYKHKHLEFFIADDVDISTFRDEMASMEHPFFALKGGDMKVREYKNGNVVVIVRPAAEIGLATIFDKDIWIYAISKLQEAINNNQPISRTVAFTPYDFFVTTNRAKSGRAYEDLKKALSRLSGTRIQTNIIYSDNDKKTIDFGLIDKWEIVEKQKGKLEIGMVEVTLPDWLYQAITKTKVLQINPDFFRIRKAIDRRIYEIARKHCGSQHEFTISLDKLYSKIGTSSLLKEFKRKLKALLRSNDLPDYEIFLDISTDKVTFKNRNQNTPQAEASRKQEKGKQEIYKIKKSLLNK
ncbi:replication initiator protein A (plasmid) [Arsenophonus nasoniae]|uniref:Replication initiator protein A n=1 Tax=Arsenophonus nasoniae TaxID=638 RepID=A0A4P7L8Z8_9GAMM|nr:replication initiator protein A [Arsenophonus nasoniae]QBY46338.1 Replication initiator protein A [Arsenophonus nasoniae]WGM08644.1 replication initiator protein A [Arsenophonus nasoniae]WGM13452.1 replication initiator protein A [Arsenophonus nasoniae]WGM18039.1 replication initiator protein A [Arsenophonus nasoniae]